jgi:hypothetical protein
MAEMENDRETLLRQEFHGQTAKINWHDLQTYYAHGSVVSVVGELDLVEVAVQLGMDNTEQFQQWIAGHQVAPVSDEQALAWYESNQLLWAVVAPPWVLVQQRG